MAEMMKNPAIASVNMNFVCSGEVKVPQNVLNTIKGTKLTVAFHSGNGVALSISGQDLKNKDLSKIQNIDLTVDQKHNPGKCGIRKVRNREQTAGYQRYRQLRSECQHSCKCRQGQFRQECKPVSL